MTTTAAQWPADDLEVVPSCPVCGEHASMPMYDGLTDNVFGTAPGTWSLKRCMKCASGYLTPRPTPASIDRAYEGYYTHAADDHPLVRPIGRIRSFLHAGINSYHNRHYDTGRSPSSTWGRWVVTLIPSLRSAADAVCRHLPPLPATGGHLLDIGCGNGGFLMLAQEAGWTAEGIDFDAEAVRTAQSRGLTVQLGGIDVLDNRLDRYDVITLSHVIEHVHDPASFLRRLLDLLKPGGTLWLETPNLSSLGSCRFGRAWRGLEPPRHLVLFNRSSLKQLLRSSGFRSLRQHWHGMIVFEMFAASESIARGDSGTMGSYRGRPPWRAMLAELYEMLVPTRREFLTFTARKPSGAD